MHGTTSSCGVMIGNLGNKKFLVNKISKDNNGRVYLIKHIFSFCKKVFEERLLNESKNFLVFLKNIPIPSPTGEKR